MSIKAKLNAAGEIEFELENAEDIQALLTAAKNGAVAVSTTGVPQTRVERLRELYSRIQARPVQRKIILALADEPTWSSDVALRERAGLENNNKLGGTIAGIQKSAKAVGLTLENVLVKRSLPPSSKPAVYVYRLTPDMMDVVAGNKAKHQGS